MSESAWASPQTAERMCNPELQRPLQRKGSLCDHDVNAVDKSETSDQPAIPNSQVFKQKGNEHLKESKPKAAVTAYSSALEAAALEQLDDHEKAVLLSNRSFAYIKCNLFVKVTPVSHSYIHTSQPRAEVALQQTLFQTSTLSCLVLYSTMHVGVEYVSHVVLE